MESVTWFEVDADERDGERAFTDTFRAGQKQEQSRFKRIWSTYSVHSRLARFLSFGWSSRCHRLCLGERTCPITVDDERP